MKKLLSFITADIREEVNAWIDANIPNAGPNTFAAPYSATGKGAITHYATCWRISDKDKATLISYLNKDHGDKHSLQHILPEEIPEKINLESLKAWDNS